MKKMFWFFFSGCVYTPQGDRVQLCVCLLSSVGRPSGLSGCCSSSSTCQDCWVPPPPPPPHQPFSLQPSTPTRLFFSLSLCAFKFSSSCFPAAATALTSAPLQKMCHFSAAVCVEHRKTQRQSAWVREGPPAAWRAVESHCEFTLGRTSALEFTEQHLDFAVVFYPLSKNYCHVLIQMKFR